MSAAAKSIINTVFKKEVRSNRLHNDQNKLSAELEVNGTGCQIINFSESGISFKSSSKLSSEETHSVKLKLFKTHVIELTGKVIWQKKEGEEFFVGFQFVNGFLKEGVISAIEAAADIFAQVNSEVSKYKMLDEKFKVVVTDIKTYLTHVRERLTKIDHDLQIKSRESRETHYEIILSCFAPEFIENLKKFNKQMDQIYSKITAKDEREVYKQFFKKNVGEFYTDNPFIGRALRKPLGYAGDFEMMNQIYRDEYEGKGLFEMLMHKYGICEDSSMSVKYRKNYLIEKIKSRSKNKSDNFVVGSLASGPAREIFEFLKEVPVEDSKKYTFILMDQDTESLLNAKRNISNIILERGLRCQTIFAPLSVKSILEQSEEAKLLKLCEFDLLYTAGLYDYLVQPVAKLLTSYLIPSVREDGMMIIGNFHPDNPTKTISDLAADWRLVHRTEEDMKDLITGIGVKDANVHKDNLGIDLFLEILK